MLGFNDIKPSIGYSRRTLYRRIKNGLWTNPVRLSANRVAWPANEVTVLIAAHIAGKTDDQIKRVVTKLEKSRQQPISKTSTISKIPKQSTYVQIAVHYHTVKKK